MAGTNQDLETLTEVGMGYEITYDRQSGYIVVVRETSAPRDDLAPGEDQDKLFLKFDFGDRPVSAFRVDTERGTLVQREDYAPP